LVVGVATATIIAFALVGRAPQIALRWEWAAVLAVVTLAMLASVGAALWRTTRFN
jgi:hypothetical protein